MDDKQELGAGIMTDVDTRQDGGASSDEDRATAAEPVVSALRDGIPSAFAKYDTILEASAEMERRFSEPNPELWLDLLAKANPQTLTVCKHLEGEREDQACRCGYPGSVWADPEHVLFTMGDVWGSEKSLQAPRIQRSAEIATAQLLTCLYNNADWLISLAAIAIETRRAGTGTGSVHESAGLAEASPTSEGGIHA